MDNLITGAIAVAIFLAFVLGLAESIGKIPFTLIVVIKAGLKQEKDKKSGAAQ